VWNPGLVFRSQGDEIVRRSLSGRGVVTIDGSV